MSDQIMTHWKQRVEQAKRDILSPSHDAVPSTLRMMAETQLSAAIEDVELLLLQNEGASGSTIQVHISRVLEASQEHSFSLIQQAWKSTHVTDCCQRFIDRYADAINTRGFTDPSPA